MPNPDKLKVKRAKRTGSKLSRRVAGELAKPDDFADERWLRYMGFRPSGKFSPTANFHYWGGMSRRLAGSRWLTFIEPEVCNYKNGPAFPGQAGWLTLPDGTKELLGQLTRHGILFIIQASRSLP